MSWPLPLGLRGLAPRVRSKKSPGRANRGLPALEVLEDRTVPSTLPVLGSLNFTGLTNTPVAINDWTDTDGSTPVTVNVLANDTASAGASLRPGTVAVVRAPLHGGAGVNPMTGQIIYRGNGNFAGTDTFQYVVRDTAGGLSNPATVSVRVNRPTAADDWTDTDGTTPVTVNVLENDTDPDGNEHIDPAHGGRVARVSAPAHGTATLNPDGSFTYTAAAGFTGTDSFRYTVTDDAGATSLPATVFVRVNVPTANDDLASFSGTTPVNIAVLANDTDPDGNDHIDPAHGGSVALVSPPAHGTATLNADGSFTYTAAAGFTGTDSFRYTVADDAGATSAPGTVTVVGSAGAGANDDFTDTDGTTPVVVDVLANDHPPGGGGLLLAGSVVITSSPRHGRVQVDPTTGAVTYTAFAGFRGTDTFQYSVKAQVPGIGIPPPGTTIVTMNATASVHVNAPVAADDWTDTDGATPVTVAVLANDADPDGNEHIDPTRGTGAAVTLVSPAAHGSVTRNADGSFTYTAFPGFTGTDSFRYTVTDDAGATSAPATVLVRVNTPTAADDFAQATGTAPVVIDVLANDTDPDGNSHLVAGSVSIVTPPQHGSVSVNSSGQVTYTANPGWGGTDTFRYTVSDDAGATSAPATVTVTTLVPVARAGIALLSGVRGTTFNVLSVARDPFGAAALAGAVVTITVARKHGHVMVNPVTRQITYVANAGFFGVDTVGYTITDRFGATSGLNGLVVDLLPPLPFAVLFNIDSVFSQQYHFAALNPISRRS